MNACPSCGSENPEGKRFCGDCGTLLSAPTPPVAEERKVVTSLFCDLVGFTATSESADPEDVARMLADYFAVARAQIEAHGGVVEKFIGDAVVGEFGIPAAHEDDPERAVRAGLRIIEDAHELQSIGGAPLKLRIGINTGEALVRLGISPGSGERVASGDAINTASRIQSVAPEMGVAVGVSTYAATAAIFDYAELAPAKLKGKAEPVRVFHAIAPRARLGTELPRAHDTPFIGRENELALLKEIFDKTVASNSVHLVTVIGEPGLGKSRMVAELAGYADNRPDLITWRQGRCLPYGQGITFWALGEILKTHAGILESDPAGVATSKLDQVLPEGEETAWFRQRLLPLLGIEATSPAEREELFTAWRRFLEHVAEQDPTVLVFEDLHWADDAMLAFLEHLVDRAEGVPLLVVGTARPELFERRPDYAAGLRNTTHINLTPLSQEETARLVAALLQTTVLPAELQRPILERAGGNPLYAEEFVRLLKDKDLLVKEGANWQLREGAEVPLPDSVQALIAARLDTLPTDTKSMLADAAILGRVFWAGAVVQMGERDPAEVTEVLEELSRKDLVRPVRRSSIEGEAEYAFWHVLTRDVAYAQLPRASRASRHVAAARWIESKAPDRVENIADVLAYHYGTALELARAAGQAEQAGELEASALRFLTLAGERALGLDAAAAVSNLERALALTPPGHPGRPEALTAFGEAAWQAGRSVEARKVLEEATASFRARGDPAATAHALMTLLGPLEVLGDPLLLTIPAEAVALLESLPPGPELVEALTDEASSKTIQGESEAGLRGVERALALAEGLGLERPARALGFKGMARAQLGDPEGLQDMREAIALATERGQGQLSGTLQANLGVQLWAFEGPDASLDVLKAGVAFATARGLVQLSNFITQCTLFSLYDIGEFDQALEVANDLADHLETTQDPFALIGVRGVQIRILALRGQASQLKGWIDWLESAVRESGRHSSLLEGLEASIFARAALGQNETAAALLAEIDATPGLREFYYEELPALVRTAVAIGHDTLGERLAAGVESRSPYAEHALIAAAATLAEARGDLETAADTYADAADRWERFGVVPEQAFAHLGQGRCLLGLSRPTEAAPALQRAREIFERLGAAPALTDTDALIKEATPLTS